MSEALTGGIDAFVGGSQGHPHVLRACGTIKIAGSGQDATRGQPVDGVPARVAACHPQIEGTFRIRDGEARRLECSTKS